MKNFGLTSLHIVNPKAVLGPNGRMRGAHAQGVLDSIVEHRSLDGALEGLDLSIGTTAQKSYSSSNLVRKPMTPRELAWALRSQAGKVGIVFGREGTGLNNAELGQCDAILTVPASPEYPTLNLSHAAAIVFYELHSATVESSRDELASEQVKETILRFLADSTALSGMEAHDRFLLARAFRNVLGRSALRHREGSLLAEAFRRISEALPHVYDPAASEMPPTALAGSSTGSSDYARKAPSLSQAAHPKVRR